MIGHLLSLCYDRLVLCGDSAGGAIALALDAGLPDALRGHVAGAASFYGAYGLFDTPSLLAKGSRADSTDAACVNRYFDLAGGREAYSLAMLARPSGVPVYLIAAGDDPLLDDSLRLAGALRRCGRSIVLDVAVNENHGFLHQAGRSTRASEAIRKAAAWMRDIIA